MRGVAELALDAGGGEGEGGLAVVAAERLDLGGDDALDLGAVGGTLREGGRAEEPGEKDGQSSTHVCRLP